MRRDNTGAYIEYDRDNLGNITARRVKNSGGTTLLSQTATFDELRRLLTFVGAASQTWTHGYDKTDNRVSVTDPRSNVHQWSFESLNRLISETDEGAEIDARQLDIMSTWQRARSRQHSVLGDFDVPKLHQDLRYCQLRRYPY